MFRNYLKTAWRNLKTSKFYSLINIGGLAIGLATGIMLLLWVQNERSYDKFNHNYKNIYNLSAHFPSNGGKDITWNGAPGPLAVYARSMPQVKKIVRIDEERGQLLSNSGQTKMIENNTVACVDPGFFSMFDFKLAEGNKSRLFPNNNSIVLSHSTAEKIFGTDNALGKIVVLNKENFSVTGILEDFPGNSSLQYDAII
ncbi:MAG TPA: ABC transporter permease, partial [Chitinophagaceae bacterium]